MHAVCYTSLHRNTTLDVSWAVTLFTPPNLTLFNWTTCYTSRVYPQGVWLT